VFKVTLGQLKARDGSVRCGRCTQVFRADQHLYALPGWRREPTAPPVSEPTGQPEAVAAETSERPAPAARPSDEIPVVSDLSLFQPGRRRVSGAVWGLGNLLVVVALAAQFAYFYRDELSANAALRPHLARFCELVGCELIAYARPLPPELVETTIAPHPRYANALRLRAVFVNRTDRPQPFPLMEVSLTDSAGTLLARRIFKAPDYLETSISAREAMPPNVIFNALLEVTNPDERAAGYEVQLLPP
jgi:predicted Zn finger-like uncharacterized protein